jgi:DNA-binding NarL/FixJ family response regulator
MELLVMPYRVLLVDDAPAVREALRWALEDEPDLVIVGEAGDGAEALRRVAALRPDLVILDIALPDTDGYAVARALRAAPQSPRILFLSVHADDGARWCAALAGGDGFVEKGGAHPALLSEMRRVLARG